LGPNLGFGLDELRLILVLLDAVEFDILRHLLHFGKTTGIVGPGAVCDAEGAVSAGLESWLGA